MNQVPESREMSSRKSVIMCVAESDPPYITTPDIEYARLCTFDSPNLVVYLHWLYVFFYSVAETRFRGNKDTALRRFESKCFVRVLCIIKIIYC